MSNFNIVLSKKMFDSFLLVVHSPTAYFFLIMLVQEGNWQKVKEKTSVYSFWLLIIRYLLQFPMQLLQHFFIILSHDL